MGGVENAAEDRGRCQAWACVQAVWSEMSAVVLAAVVIGVKVHVVGACRNGRSPRECPSCRDEPQGTAHSHPRANRTGRQTRSNRQHQKTARECTAGGRAVGVVACPPVAVGRVRRQAPTEVMSVEALAQYRDGGRAMCHQRGGYTEETRTKNTTRKRAQSAAGSSHIGAGSVGMRAEGA